MRSGASLWIPPLSDLDFCLCVLDPCQSNPCEHGGNCIIRGDTFHCSCPAPFSGSRCQNGEPLSLCPLWVKREALQPPSKGTGKALDDPGAKASVCFLPPYCVSWVHSVEKQTEAKRGQEMASTPNMAQTEKYALRQTTAEE